MRHARLWIGTALATALIALGATTAGAADGIKLLRQPGSFPLVIDKSGSYRLRGPITVPNANTTAILIKDTAPDVTLDLNGFAISGPTDCPGVPGPACAPLGTGIGIATECSGLCPLQGTLVIKDGTVRGMGRDGINVSVAQVRIERVSLHDNGNDGLFATGSVAVRDSFANTNGGTGFYIRDPGVITGSIALLNGENGMFLEGADSGFVAADNIASRNLGNGIEVDSAPVAARGNVAARNFQGFRLLGSDSVVQGNLAIGNNDIGIVAPRGVLLGNVMSGNALGLESQSALVAHNLANDNNLVGMELGDSGVSANVLSANNGGLGELNGGVELAPNLCGVDMTCP